MANKVFIATSIDGFIADNNNSVDWLNKYPAPENAENVFASFIDSIDAIIMGRNTFEVVVSFGLEIWPYTKPVYVLSNSMIEIPKEYADKATLVTNTSIEKLLDLLHAKNYKNLYIDGGKLIQSFLEKDLIDEMTLTRAPILLGKGVPLFAPIDLTLEFELTNSQELYSGLTSTTYTRKRVN